MTVLPIAVERCPLCDGIGSRLYCPTCIFSDNELNQGDQGSICVKVVKLHTSWKRRDALAMRIWNHKFAKRILEKNRKVVYASSLKRHIKELKGRIEGDKAKLRSDSNAHEIMQVGNSHLDKHASRHYNNLMQRKNRLHSAKDNMNSCRDLCAVLEGDVQRLRHTVIKDLFTYVFPIRPRSDFPEACHHPKSDDTSSASSLCSDLLDATQTVLVHGRWIRQKIDSSLLYSVVESLLPSSGDYSQYSESGGEQSKFAVGAGLGYLCQICSLLSAVLGVVLPVRLPTKELLSCALNDSEFAVAVAQLNHAVLHLCCSQGLRPDFAKHTVYNVLMIRDQQSIRNPVPFEIPNDLLESIHDIYSKHSSVIAKFNAADDESAFDLDDDWERVPLDLPLPDCTSRFPENYQFTPTVNSFAGTTGGSYVTSSGQVVGASGPVVTSLSHWWKQFSIR